MNYHDITVDDMKNGEGLRVVLWLSGCEHHCTNCQNPITWDADKGKPFEWEDWEELKGKLSKPHISGLTLSGGDPMHPENRTTVLGLLIWFKSYFPQKTVWLYTGYTLEQISFNVELLAMLKYVDVLVDGKYEEQKKDINYPWAGSTNQRVINVQETLKKGTIVPYVCH